MIIKAIFDKIGNNQQLTEQEKLELMLWAEKTDRAGVIVSGWSLPDGSIRNESFQKKYNPSSVWNYSQNVPTGLGLGTELTPSQNSSFSDYASIFTFSGNKMILGKETRSKWLYIGGYIYMTGAAGIYRIFIDFYNSSDVSVYSATILGGTISYINISYIAPVPETATYIKITADQNSGGDVLFVGGLFAEWFR